MLTAGVPLCNQPFGASGAPDGFDQVAPATDSICFSSVLAFPVRRLRTSLLCFLPPVARRRLFFLFSFLSFRVVFLSPSPLPVCLVGLSVGWCVGLLVCRVVGVGSVPFRSVPLLCLLLPAVSALPAAPRCRPPWRPAGIESVSGPPGSPPLGLTPVRWISGSEPWRASSGGLYSAGSRARRGTPSHTVFFCAPGACTARF